MKVRVEERRTLRVLLLHATEDVPRSAVAVESVAWSPDSESIVTAGEDGCVHTWSAAEPDLELLLTEARERSFRQLSAGERRGAMLPERTAE